jgi:hypothetical protein
MLSVSLLRRNFLQRGPLNKYAAATAKQKLRPSLLKRHRLSVVGSPRSRLCYSLFEKPCRISFLLLLYLFGLTAGNGTKRSSRCFHRKSATRPTDSESAAIRMIAQTYNLIAIS